MTFISSWGVVSFWWGICGITVFVGYPPSNVNATAGLCEDTVFLPLLA